MHYSHLKLLNVLLIGTQVLACGAMNFNKPSSQWNVSEQITVASTSLGSKQKSTR